MNSLIQLRQSFSRLLSRPTEELTRAQRSLRFAVDLTRYCSRELIQNRAPQMAAALTYRTLFSLVPMAMLGLLVFRAFIGLENAQVWLQDAAYDFLGWSETVALTGDVAPQPVVSGETTERDPRAEVADALNGVVDRAWESLDFRSLGVVGLVVLIWAALALLITVEQCFNLVYNCPEGRPWHHRIAIYWAVVTLGPVLLFVSLHLAGNLVDWAEDLTPGVRAVHWLSGFAALGASWLMLFIVYMLMPNTSVYWRSALGGSFIAAVLWETGKWGFKLYVNRAVTISALYGSLGLILLFLLWVYLTWLIVLFGLQVSYTLQALKGRKFQIDEAVHRRHQIGDPHWLVAMMALIGRSFFAGEPVSVEKISRRLLISGWSVARIGELLEQKGLLHRVEATRRHESGYSLAVPPDQIPVSRLLELGRTMSEGQTRSEDLPAKAMLDQLYKAQHDAAGDASLASVIRLDP